MNKTAKKYLTGAGIAAGISVGAFLGTKSMEAENPYKDDVESVAKLAITGAVATVALVGVGAFSARTYQLEAERNRLEIKKLKENLPKIRKIKDPLIFAQYLAEFEPDKIKPYSEAHYMITPVINAYSRTLGPEHDAFKLEMLSMTVDRLRACLSDIHLNRDNYENYTQVIDAAWFLDQTFPISPDCTVTPKNELGQKNWLSYVHATVDQVV